MLCRYADVPMCVSTYSKGGEWFGELVDVGSGASDADYQGIDVRGKVALASGYAANVVREAVLKHGAVGVVIYPMAQDRPDHPDLVRYNGIWPRAEELNKTSGGFQISRNQYDMVKSLMKQGAVRVHGKIDATLGPGKLTLVHAYIRGTGNPEREILITGHLDHPKWSANDNASGSGAMMEAARTLQALITAKKLEPPKLTIHFMWVPEYFGTLAYVTNHPEARHCDTPWDDPRNKPDAFAEGKPCILANINMDMVGEDTVKTNSRFYFTKSPDSVPSVLDGCWQTYSNKRAKPISMRKQALAITGCRRRFLMRKAATTMYFSAWAFPPPCSAMILIGRTIPVKTKLTKPTQANSGG